MVMEYFFSEVADIPKLKTLWLKRASAMHEIFMNSFSVKTLEWLFLFHLVDGSRYSRMDQIKFVEDSL